MWQKTGEDARDPWYGFWITCGMILISVGILVYAYFNSPPMTIVLALFAGAVGGIVHEFAQSGGTIAFPAIKEDGIYLGALSGLFLGMVASFIIFDPAQPSEIIMTQSILAGLGLKGVTEAVGGQVVQKVQGSFNLENVRRDVPNNSVTITVRNTGSIIIKIDRVYVDSQEFALGVSIPTESAHAIQVGPINPRITQSSLHTIKVLTSKGMSQTISV